MIGIGTNALPIRTILRVEFIVYYVWWVINTDGNWFNLSISPLKHDDAVAETDAEYDDQALDVTNGTDIDYCECSEE